CRRSLRGRADGADLAVAAGLRRHRLSVAGASGRRGGRRVTQWLLDGVLGLLLLTLAGGALHVRQLYAGVLLFTAFGVVLALVWARLGAPDLALAEAAIGAGLTGALLLVSYRRLVHSVPKRVPRSRPAAHLAAPLGLLTAALVLWLAAITVAMPPGAASAGQEVLRRMPEQPVANPVTAVLLLFRGYDTLMEMAVLLAAYLGAR